MSLTRREHKTTARRTPPILVLAVCLAAVGFAAPVRAAAAAGETEIENFGPMPSVGIKQIALSPNGRRMAYVLKRAKKAAVFLDGREQGEYDAVSGLKFSPNGKHLGYAAARSRTWFIVINGKEGQKFTSLKGPVFSPNGKHLAYTNGLGGKKRYLVFDGAPRLKYTAVGQEEPVFSPDGRHLAYEARTSGKSKRVSIRDPNRPERPDERPPDFVTQDGREVDVSDNSAPRTNFIVRDGKRGPRTNDIRTPVFSPNSRVLAYAALFSHKWFIVVDDKKAGKLYDDVGRPVFSPDSRKLAYPAKLQDKWFVVRGRKAGDAFDGIRHLRFSPDGKHLAYAAREDRKWFVVCNGKKGPQYDDIGWVGFSGDARHLAYSARRGKGKKWMIVCDGVEWPAHARVVVPRLGAGMLKDKFRYVAIDTEARLVEVNWPTETDWSNGLK